MVKEAVLMLKALVTELSDITELELTVLLADEFQYIQFPEQIKCLYISGSDSFDDYLAILIERNDAVWPIAPESDSVLYDLSVSIAQRQALLLNSTASAVAVCADKLLTAEKLKVHGIKVVNTSKLSEFTLQTASPWVLKPLNAEGCEQTYLIKNREELQDLKLSLDDKAEYIIQPYIVGQTLSLSCLFKNGRAWLICCNRQKMLVQKGLFSLQACEVNVSDEHNIIYQQLIDQIAQAITGLWGYVGIDIIQPESSEPIVLEINPRLTTSYAGISSSLGLNVAEQVINMINYDPIIEKPFNKQTIVSIVKDN